MRGRYLRPRKLFVLSLRSYTKVRIRCSRWLCTESGHRNAVRCVLPSRVVRIPEPVVRCAHENVCEKLFVLRELRGGHEVDQVSHEGRRLVCAEQRELTGEGLVERPLHHGLLDELPLHLLREVGPIVVEPFRRRTDRKSTRGNFCLKCCEAEWWHQHEDVCVLHRLQSFLGKRNPGSGSSLFRGECHTEVVLRVFDAEVVRAHDGARTCFGGHVGEGDSVRRLVVRVDHGNHTRLGSRHLGGRDRDGRVVDVDETGRRAPEHHRLGDEVGAGDGDDVPAHGDSRVGGDRRDDGGDGRRRGRRRGGPVIRTAARDERENGEQHEEVRLDVLEHNYSFSF